MSGRDERPSVGESHIKPIEERLTTKNVIRGYIDTSWCDFRNDPLEYTWDYVADNVLKGLLIVLLLWSSLIIPWYWVIIYCNSSSIAFIAFIFVIGLTPTIIWGFYVLTVTFAYFVGRF